MLQRLSRLFPAHAHLRPPDAGRDRAGTVALGFLEQTPDDLDIRLDAADFQFLREMTAKGHASAADQFGDVEFWNAVAGHHLDAAAILFGELPRCERRRLALRLHLFFGGRWRRLMLGFAGHCSDLIACRDCSVPLAGLSIHRTRDEIVAQSASGGGM